MIPHVPDQRKFKSNASKPFNDLVKYITEEQETVLEAVKNVKQRATSPDFSDIIDYATAKLDKESKDEKCIAVRTHGVKDLSTASIEMNAVARMNHKCKDAAYHVILSWPEHEQPAPDAIFDAAEHALAALGLKEHQYVLAVHGNTDNMHCHISVNRVHPVTFKAHHIEWAVKTLHLAARQSEIKHGWTHDKGIYIVEIDGRGKKHIVLNPDHAAALGKAPYAHPGKQTEPIFPAWHDPESLDSWLKSKVARALKRDLGGLESWPALHAWLGKHDISLSDTGGGGMRLYAVSAETGEVLDLPVSKGLRILKRSDLEKRWGPFTNSIPVTSVVPDLTHLTDYQIAQGVDDVLSRDRHPGRDPHAPPEHVLRAQQYRSRAQAEGGSGMHELSFGGLDDDGPGTDLPLPHVVHDDMGNKQTGQDPDLRRAGSGEASGRSARSLRRDDSKRAERKAQRAAARLDLRQRFSQYKRFVRVGDTEHFKRTKLAQTERRAALKLITDQSQAAKAAIPAGTKPAVRLIATVEIDAESLRRRLEAAATYQEAVEMLRSTRTPPLSWRAWLYEQANLGDQAALSALRGIVYQAQRDAKGDVGVDAPDVAEDVDAEAYREEQYHMAMARLLDEEKSELAIRSGSPNAMRPHEIDALIRRYKGVQWNVTGNGNVAYSDQGGRHLFTDRGNRITFDRVRVTDQEILLALAHAQTKFGNRLTLTGTDQVFAERMAQLAVEMDIRILNPELQYVAVRHRDRNKKKPAIVVESEPLRAAPVVEMPAPSQAQFPAGAIVEVSPSDPQDQLRAMVLAIDPEARFVTPSTARGMRLYVGPVAVALDEPAIGFAQHTGRSVYALHMTSVPMNAAGVMVEVKYDKGVVAARTLPATEHAQEDAEVVSEGVGARSAAASSESAPEALMPAPNPTPLLTAHEWLLRWAEEGNRRVSHPVAENGSVLYSVLYVADDGVVINKGRSGAVYPAPIGLILSTGDSVTVGPTAALARPTAQEKDDGRAPRR